MSTGLYRTAALDNLVPEFLASVPADPFSPRTNGANAAPLRYKRVDAAADPEGRDYHVYTVAGDGADDAGREDPSSHRDAVPDASKGKGFDYAINQGPKKPAGDAAR